MQKKSIVWKVDWVFRCGMEDPVTITKKVSETLPLFLGLSYVIKDLQEEERQKISTYLAHDLSTWTICLRVFNSPDNNPQWHKLTPSKSLKESLRGKDLVEYPELHVCTPPFLSMYPICPEPELPAVPLVAPDLNNTDKSSEEIVGKVFAPVPDEELDGDEEDDDVEEVEELPSKRQKVEGEESNPELAHAITEAVFADLFDFV
eukprot:TRINITY_DN3204_c0_g1_i2.p1 TRINITY_DN3204_c0_g1~~TRINITY_DN3204_c0_g1_i2.p1  ORF type:complete len:204 (-),score=59.00 TRINITY_DN3204_c0_g1_i2:121-732(-)